VYVTITDILQTSAKVLYIACLKRLLKKIHTYFKPARVYLVVRNSRPWINIFKNSCVVDNIIIFMHACIA